MSTELFLAGEFMEFKRSGPLYDELTTKEKFLGPPENVLSNLKDQVIRNLQELTDAAYKARAKSEIDPNFWADFLRVHKEFHAWKGTGYETRGYYTAYAVPYAFFSKSTIQYFMLRHVDDRIKGMKERLKDQIIYHRKLKEQYAKSR